MKIVIIGGVAGGMSAATRLRRLNEDAEIIVIERGEHVSFANCGLPYYAGDVITARDSLLLQTPQSLYDRFRLDVRTHNELINIDPTNNKVTIKNLTKDSPYSLEYDQLILSMGAKPFVPPMEGHEKLLTLRNVNDVDKIKAEINTAKTKGGNAVVIGAGFIGLEIAENLRAQNLTTTIVELHKHVLPPLEPELAGYVEEELRNNDVNLVLNESVEKVLDDKVITNSKNEILTDVTIGAIGVRPEVSVAKEADIEIGELGGVLVNEKLQTNFENIFAIGDMVEKHNAITGANDLIALANIANKQGRRVADIISGLDNGTNNSQGIGSAVVKVFDLTIAMVGANAKKLKDSNIDFVTIHTHGNNHAGYYPGARTIHMITHVDPRTHKILGAQAVGPAESARKIDVVSTAMFAGLKVTDFIDLELTYAPQYGSAKDVINMIGYIADGILNWGDKVTYANKIGDKVVLDVRTKAEYAAGSIPNSINIPVDEIRDRINEVPKGTPIVVNCQVGLRGHVAARLLTQKGLEVHNLSGGYETWKHTPGIK
jgi:NADPH-dependent 2,4-dienoyl-CoA reductase/sulfur reductase-like enzyme/rhodanese-related sulfurtransferase